MDEDYASVLSTHLALHMMDIEPIKYSECLRYKWYSMNGKESLMDVSLTQVVFLSETEILKSPGKVQDFQHQDSCKYI